MKQQQQATARRPMMGDRVTYVSDGSIVPPGEYPALVVSAHGVALTVFHPLGDFHHGAVSYRPRSELHADLRLERAPSWHYRDE
jgi:hypothetical protein